MICDSGWNLLGQQRPLGGLVEFVNQARPRANWVIDLIILCRGQRYLQPYPPFCSIFRSSFGLNAIIYSFDLSAGGAHACLKLSNCPLLLRSRPNTLFASLNLGLSRAINPIPACPLKKSDHVVVVIVSPIQRIGCQPEKSYLTRQPIPL